MNEDLNLKYKWYLRFEKTLKDLNLLSSNIGRFIDDTQYLGASEKEMCNYRSEVCHKQRLLSLIDTLYAKMLEEPANE